MQEQLGIIGAGVSGLTCAVLLAEAGYRTRILAEEIGAGITSAAAGAIWFPYDAEPVDAVIGWSLETFAVLQGLSRTPGNGVSMIELRQFSRSGEIEIPAWALSLGAQPLDRATLPSCFRSGFALAVPLTDTTIYLDYLAARFRRAGGAIQSGLRFDHLEEVSDEYSTVINCTGIGAKTLLPDPEVEPHRGQVVVVAGVALEHAVVSDDPPLMYAIPRSQDCVLGGTNEVSDSRAADSDATARIVTECQRVLGSAAPVVLSERVGLRPSRKGGVRVAVEKLRDGRVVIHNYGHGGAGFTLSWGCAQTVFELAQNSV